MGKLRVGIAGLGNIAQKAWLPVLAHEQGWQITGAWSPGQEKAQRVCQAWRIPCAASLADVLAGCDALFVHTATHSHYDVVSAALRAGVHVCVDKPLAVTLSDAEKLVSLARQKKCALMVGFNRRFAPHYQTLKSRITDNLASLRMEKHRADSVGPHDLHFTLLDDYLHVVDTALWLAGGEGKVISGRIQTSEQGEMLYAEHHFSVQQALITTSMHRRAGSQAETIQAVTDGGLFWVKEMREWIQECGQGVVSVPVPGWQSTLEQRGFFGCVQHFISSVENQTPPLTSGEQALLAQRIVERLWREAISE